MSNSSSIPINLAVEDELSEVVLRRMICASGLNYAIGACFKRSGFGYLRKRIAGFNQAAKWVPFFVLTDLDRTECAPLLLEEWLQSPKHHNLVFRIAVRAVESWVLAHRDAFAFFLGIQTRLIPASPDDLTDPKRTLMQITAKSRKRELREAIVPRVGSTARVGPDYNSALMGFVQGSWDVRQAVRHSPSLRRAYDAIVSFSPVIG